MVDGSTSRLTPAGLPRGSRPRMRRALLLAPIVAILVVVATAWHTPWAQPVLGVLLALLALSWSVARHMR